MIIPYMPNFRIRPLKRRIISWGYTALLNILFGLRLHYYNGPFVIRTDLLRTVPVNTRGFAFMASILLRLIKHKRTFVEVGMMIEPRHFGILVLCTLGLFVLARSKKTKFSLSGVFILALVILTIQSMSGFWAVYAEGRDTFSQSKNLAEWLQANYPGEIPVVYPDHVGATLCFYKEGYTYSLASGTGEESTFVRQRKENLKPFSPEMINEQNFRGEDRLLITNSPFHAILYKGKTVVEPLNSFEPAVAPNESFWVQRVHFRQAEEGSKEEPWTCKLLPFEGQILTISTPGEPEKENLGLSLAKFDNELGSTAEVKARFLEAPTTGYDGAVFSLLDGAREAKLSFYPDRVTILDQNEVVGSCPIDTGDGFHICRKYGIHTFSNNILGLPYATIENEIETIDLNIKAKASFVEFPIFHPYPRTELGDYCIEKGIYQPDYYGLHMSYMNKSPLSCFTEKEKNAQRNLSTLGLLVIWFPFLRNIVLKHLIYLPYNRFHFLLYYIAKVYLNKTRVYPMKLGPRGVWNTLRKSLKLESFKKFDEHKAVS